MTPLLIRYRGGSLDGRTLHTNDDQVPAHIAIAKFGIWEHYAATNKRYDDGLLVEVTYAFTHED
jgi:hypothetical protein